MSLRVSGIRWRGTPRNLPPLTIAADGSWRVELNTEVLPRVLVNQTYAATVNAARVNEADKSFLTNCLQNANWLTKSLEQRARTILKVASEIVRQQDGFLAHGVEHLRPNSTFTSTRKLRKSCSNLACLWWSCRSM